MYRVRGLLRPSECEAILGACRTTPLRDAFQRVAGCPRSRLLGFESNEVMLRAMETRLGEGMPEAVRCGSVPYGFGTEQMSWVTSGALNPCMRITHYEYGGDHFPEHRDAQYTEAFNARSSHTLLVYLNSDFDGGETVLGHHRVRPVQGDALVFDQRWEHTGNPTVNGTKFVLRSDLVSRSDSPRPSLSDVEERMHTLTARLFRQAQYHELEGDIVSAGRLYALVMDLRCGAIPRDVYPADLEGLLTPIPMAAPVTGTNLECVSRTGHTTLYRYSPHTEDVGTCREYVRVAIVHSLAHNTRRMVKDAVPFPRLLRGYREVRSEVGGPTEAVTVTEGPETERDAVLHTQGVVDALCSLFFAKLMSVSRGDVEWIVRVWKAGMHRYDGAEEGEWRAVVDAIVLEFDALRDRYRYRGDVQNLLWDHMHVSDIVRPLIRSHFYTSIARVATALQELSLSKKAFPPSIRRDVIDVITKMVLLKEAGYVRPFPVLFEYIVCMNLQWNHRTSDDVRGVFPSDVVRHIQRYLLPEAHTDSPGDHLWSAGKVHSLASDTCPVYSEAGKNLCVPRATNDIIPACVSVWYTEAKCSFSMDAGSCHKNEDCCSEAWGIFDLLGEEHTGPVNPYLAVSPWGDATLHLTLANVFGEVSPTTVLNGTASVWCGTSSFNHASCQGMSVNLEGYEASAVGDVEGTPVLFATTFRIDMGKCEIVIEQEPSVVIQRRRDSKNHLQGMHRIRYRR